MRRLSLLRPFFALIAVGLAGCAAADLQSYYTPEASQTFPRTETVSLVDGGTDAEAAYDAQYRNRGYVRIGRVSYVGRYADDSSFRDFGRKIGADVVLVSRRYLQSHVVENPQGPVGQYNELPQINEYGASEPQFNPAFMPTNEHESQAPDSYVVREYRQVAIFLRRSSG